MLSVADAITDPFARLFPFTFFNEMQSRALQCLLHSDGNVVVAAPTASGKTVLAELAMVRELSKPRAGKILYLAPLRALTNEKEDEWQRLFTPMGFEVYVVSGERELDPAKARSAHIIISTPEKWDSASRKHHTTHTFVKAIKVIVIDEVHLLDSDGRGGVLEVLITRMKRITNNRVRIVALSATMPNISEVARWIGATDEHTFAFDASYRPIPLKAEVFGYNPGKNKFVDKYIRLYKAVSLIAPHLAHGQALIFVATRQDTSQAASKLVDVYRTKKHNLATAESERLALRIKSRSLSETVRHGIGFHHAGLPKDDRDLVEEAFKSGHVKILISTSTLAWGVNLPARVVIIRDIANEAIDAEISSLDLLQMLGRAGRPQYDERGFGWIISPRERVKDFTRMLQEGQPIRSQLHTSIDEHLNAEISMGTIKSYADAKMWLRDTFFYVQHPESDTLIDERVRSLVDGGFVSATDEHLAPTELGTLTSTYYLRLDTARIFGHLRVSPTDEELLEAVASAAEFADVVVRRNELATIKRAQTRHTGPKAKVYAVLKAYIERGEVPEAVRSDAWIIRQNALRLLSALSAFLLRFNAPQAILRARVLALRLEYGAPEELCPLLQLEGIGIKQATQLYEQGVRSPFDITPVVQSRLIAGAKVAQSIARLPRIAIDIQLPDTIPFGHSQLYYATVRNDGGGGRTSITVSANGTAMLHETFYAAKGYVKSIPIGVYGSQNSNVTYEIRADHVDCVLDPLVVKEAVMVTGLPHDTMRMEASESTTMPAQPNAPTGVHPLVEESIGTSNTAPQVSRPRDPRLVESSIHSPAGNSVAKSDLENDTNEPAATVGHCKRCGGSLRRVDNVITCQCGVIYKLPAGADLAHTTCSCGLPKFKLKLLGVDVCVDRQCENMDDIIAAAFANHKFTCPRCESSLTVVRRRGLIVGCERYYDGCKTAFLLPANASITGRCTCGLPRLQLKTKARCLDTTCRA
ncbi:MAG: DEAD/DEAH box helicase [Euryarchaeota archaeon]|nr:DEAD/DEAH box helicase [Euryarchaeota archaeon]